MTTIPLCPVYLECVLSLRQSISFSDPSAYALRRRLIIANIKFNVTYATEVTCMQQFKTNSANYIGSLYSVDWTNANRLDSNTGLAFDSKNSTQ